MSATGRGAVRRTNDEYLTPPDTADVFLRWALAHKLLAPGMTVIDPFCGEAALLARVVAAGVPGQHWGFDIRPECKPVMEAKGFRCVITDANSAVPNDWWRFPGPLITNPPCSIAEDCIRQWAWRGTWSAWLLPTSFLSSEERRGFWAEFTPSHVLRLVNRPCFVAVCKGIKPTKKNGGISRKGCGQSYPRDTSGKCACGGSIANGTDAQSYDWVVFEKRTARGETKFDWI